jgi:hypothetical protein
VPQAHRLVHLFHFVAAAGVAQQFSAGADLAAAEIKTRGLVPEGQMFASRKPFLPYYLEGKLYFDPVRHLTFPESMAEAEALIASGRVAFLAADTLTIRDLCPYFLDLALGLAPLPGADLIYGKYFPQYRRVIVIYDLRGRDPATAAPTAAMNHRQRARVLLERGELPLAWQELALLPPDQEDDEIREMRRAILKIYQDCVGEGDWPLEAVAPVLARELRRQRETGP